MWGQSEENWGKRSCFFFSFLFTLPKFLAYSVYQFTRETQRHFSRNQKLTWKSTWAVNAVNLLFGIPLKSTPIVLFACDSDEISPTITGNHCDIWWTWQQPKMLISLCPALLLSEDLQLKSTAMANETKTSLTSINSRLLNYFTIIPTRSTCEMWPSYRRSELVGAAFKLRKRMKNSLSFSHAFSFHVIVLQRRQRKTKMRTGERSFCSLVL